MLFLDFCLDFSIPSLAALRSHWLSCVQLIFFDLFVFFCFFSSFWSIVSSKTVPIQLQVHHLHVPILVTVAIHSQQHLVTLGFPDEFIPHVAMALYFLVNIAAILNKLIHDLIL